MLTISAKKDEHNKTLYIFDGNSQISINIFEDVCDTDGYPMNGNYKFSFTTGTKEDSLAPKIEKLTAGIGEDCLSFEQYKYIIAGNNESEPNYTAEANAATNNLSAFTNGDIALTGVNKKPILKQRVKDKINIYVVATDIAGAGGNVNLGTDNQSESDVALVQVRACLYIDKEGNPITTSAKAFANNSSGTDSSSVLSVKDFGYSMGMKDSSFSGKFEDATNNATTGTLFTYDLSSLDDGLIKIDIWAVDMVGNSGDSSQYIENYNNGYRSIFVVKDSTAPDSAAEMAKVITESGTDADGVVAPYEWYNSSTLNKLQVKDQTGSANLIHDANNEFLSSDDNKLKWIFKVGNDPSWSPSSTDDEWSLIHNENNQPLVRTLSGAVSSSDGPVDVTMCLMDDLGNISNPVLLSSIMYDNTAPVVPETSSWVKLNTSDSSY